MSEFGEGVDAIKNSLEETFSKATVPMALGGFRDPLVLSKSLSGNRPQPGVSMNTAGVGRKGPAI